MYTQTSVNWDIKILHRMDREISRVETYGQATAKNWLNFMKSKNTGLQKTLPIDRVSPQKTVLSICLSTSGCNTAAVF